MEQQEREETKVACVATGAWGAATSAGLLAFSIWLASGSHSTLLPVVVSLAVGCVLLGASLTVLAYGLMEE